MKRRINEAISKLFASLGYTILPTWRLPRLALAMRLRQTFSDYDIQTVIDVGANEGQYRNFLRHEVGFKGRIESFEPVPELADRLKRSAESGDPLWSVHACALGAQQGELTLNVMASSDCSSFRKPIQAGSAEQIRRNTVVRTAVVPVRTLDSQFRDRPDLTRSYLKLDTQGYDLEVLRGGERVIAQIPAIQTELSFIAGYEGMPDYKEAIATFERHGFSVADFFLVSMDNANRAMEFDCLMVREPKRAKGC